MNIVLTNPTTKTAQHTLGIKEEMATGSTAEPLPQAFFSICYEPIAYFLESADMALIVQRIHYWLQNEKSGYLFRDGRKRIFSGYIELTQQFPWLSVDQLGRMIRRLEQIGWLVSDHFHNLKRNVGFVGPVPQMHEENRRKWYYLDYNQIFQDTGFDLLFGKAPEAQQPKRARRANLQNCTQVSANLHIPICNSADPSIYKEFQNNSKSISYDQKEILDCAVAESQESPKQEASDAPELDECQSPYTILNDLEEVNSQVQEPPVEINIPRRRATKVNKRQKFEWELEVNRPHNDFVRWRANTHYTPQGSHWAAGAVSNAFSEIVNKSNNCPEKAQALWEQFLEYAHRSAVNAQARIEDGQEAWLPSCFEQQPQLDAQHVGQELLALKQQIQQQEQAKALPAPQPQQQPVLENQPLTLEQRVKNRQLMWNSGGAVIRQVIVEWVKETPGVVMTPNGPALEADVQPEVDSAATNPSTTANPHQDAGTAAAAPRPPKSPTLAEQVSCRRLVWASSSVAPEVRQQIQLWAENTPGVVMTPDGPALE